MSTPNGLAIEEVPHQTVVKPVAYHLFEFGGVKFMFDVTTTMFFAVDDVAYALLALSLSSSLDEAKLKLNDAGQFEQEAIEGAYTEICILRDRGFMRQPSFALSVEAREKQLERFNKPSGSIQLALAENCNLACKYCYNGTSMDQMGGKMPEHVYSAAVDYVMDAVDEGGRASFTMFGGEPLLNKKGFHAVIEKTQERAQKENKTVDYSMTTNGTLLDDGVIEQLKRHPFGLLVSMDGPKDIHDAQCPSVGGRGTFDKVAAGVKRLMKRRSQVTVRCTLTSAMPRLITLIRFFESFGFTRILLGKTISSISPSGVDLSRTDFEEYSRQETEEVLPYIFENFNKGRIPKYFPYGEFIRIQESRNGAPTKAALTNCGASRGMKTVGSNGEIYPCHRYLGMKNWSLGNVLENGSDPEKEKQFWRNFDEAVTPKCGKCWARNICQRPCAWEVSDAEGNFRHIPEWNCDLRRRAIERSAYVHYRMQRDYPEVLDKFLNRSSLKSN